MSFPFAIGAAGAQLERGASYVGGEYSFSTSSILSALGAQAGDLIVTLMPGGSPSSPPTLTSGGALSAAGNQYYYRVLDGSDIAGRASLGIGGMSLLLYRGATSVASVVNDLASGVVTNRSVAGYVKHAAHVGLFGVVYSSLSGAALAIGSPATFAQRALFDPAGYIAAEQCLVADRLQPVNPYYANATPFLWSSSGGSAELRILELRA